MTTADASEDGKIGWVHTLFAYNLFVAAKGLRVDAPLDRIKIEAARSSINLWKRKAEVGWATNGHPIDWSEADYEGIAKEMAEHLPRHSFVVAVVQRKLIELRDEVFSDPLQTHNNELFVVYKAKNIGVDLGEVKETAIETINRSLDYISTMLKCGHGTNFISLNRILTILAKIHSIITDE